MVGIVYNVSNTFLTKGHVVLTYFEFYICSLNLVRKDVMDVNENKRLLTMSVKQPLTCSFRGVCSFKHALLSYITRQMDTTQVVNL